MATTTKKYKAGDMIPCRSVTASQLILLGPKTNMIYTWEDADDITEVDYADLLGLYARRSGFLSKPRFVIEDDDIAEAWGLSTMYASIADKSINALFNLPADRFAAMLPDLPVGIKDAIKGRAMNMIGNGTLYDVRMIRAIDQAFGTDFMSCLN